MNMDWVMPLVTGLSLTMAALLALLLTRLMREDRRRADARVALLTELATERRPAPHPPRPEAPQALPLESRPEPRRQPAPTADPVGDLELRPASAGSRTANDLFQHVPGRSPWRWRLAAVAALVLVVAAAAVGWRATTQPPVAGATAPVPADAQPLDLLALRHEHQAGVFGIAGLVQNPRNGAPLTGVEATVFAFGADGAMLASGRAPLDFTTLAAGDESPFVVRVPVQAPVARYRVGFRAADGRVLAHVDRRSADASARRQTP